MNSVRSVNFTLHMHHTVHCTVPAKIKPLFRPGSAVSAGFGHFTPYPSPSRSGVHCAYS